MSQYILPLNSPDASLSNSGGKGANLARLITCGFNVPPGFILTTAAYQLFARLHQLEAKISHVLAQISTTDPTKLEHASTVIRHFFTEHPLSDDLSAEILSHYHAIGSPPVAVRSSATAEDLPEMSFAGQQDTYLNIVGDDALLTAVVNCWSSLWTARAISYRSYNHIPHEQLTLAVVIQQMVPSQASGVTFTANPLTGVRTQTVINATLGLGEALVSGKVEADQYVVDHEKMVILSKSIGAKAVSIRPIEGGGTITRQESTTTTQALSDELILALTRVCKAVAERFNNPQDIEWAVADGQIYLVQSRPITSLFPLPEGVSASPLRVFGSFAAVQGVVNPITPLGQQTLMLAFVGGARVFGYHQTLESHKTLRVAGARLWSDITPIIKNSVGQKLAPQILSFVEPSIRQAVLKIITDPRLQPDRKGIRLQTRLRLARFFLPVAGNIILNMSSPQKRREMANRWIESLIQAEMNRNLKITGNRDEKFRARIANLERITELTHQIFPRLVSLVATGMAALNLTVQLINKTNGASPTEKQANALLYLELTRGLPHNVTTEMDLALWKSARAIQSDPRSFDVFKRSSPEELTASYLSQTLPPIGQKAIEAFLARYQLRGIGEIDIGRERWKDNPVQVLQTLQSYIKINDQSKAPDAIFENGAQASLIAQQKILYLLAKQKLGWLKKRIARRLMFIYRSFGGLRETPKFTIIHLTGAVRYGLLESGKEYTQDGLLSQPDDVFFLHLDELKALAGGQQKDWKKLVYERRQVDNREKNRRQIPRLFLSDGQAFYEGLTATQPTDDPNALVGSPVSPGLVEGTARIVLDPQKTSLLPGEILVCPGTDPAWTPLFLAAAGLVMEVGGLMTHGAVVAREYGIPAVVGVHQATQTIRTGQRIRVNGTTGLVEILN